MIVVSVYVWRVWCLWCVCVEDLESVWCVMCGVSVWISGGVGVKHLQFVGVYMWGNVHSCLAGLCVW